MADTNRELLFGWFQFRPKLLQFFNTPRWFLFFICTYLFTQSLVISGIYSVSITTIEKRFGYSSLLTGILTSTYDVAPLILTPLIGYFGATRKKPLICGIGMLIMGLGFFTFTLPHFLTDNYESGDLAGHVENLCSIKNVSIRATSKALSDRSTRTSWSYYALFVVGMSLTGLGATPMWTLGTSFMDENVKVKVTPMYIGIYGCSGIIGAGVGFALGGLFLSMYVDLGVQTSLTPEDERWVGAWWLGFLLSTALCVVFSLWLVAYPKEFPKTRELWEAENDKKYSIHSSPLGYIKLKEIHKATKALLLRVTYLFITLASCMESGLVAAMTTFMPKIIQQQFRYSASLVSLLIGGIVLPAALGGNIVSALICKKLKLGLTGSAKMCYIVSAVSLLTCCFLFPYCDTLPIAGVNTPYKNGTIIRVASWCNANCACSLVKYSPVCGDGVTYFSACHAGCIVTNIKTFTNCTCLGDTGHATPGSCDAGCQPIKPIAFLLIYFVVAFTTFLSGTPSTVVTLRCVPDDQRAYALGIQSSLVRLLGTFPGPIIMGRLIDSTCILWNKKYGDNQNCLEYSNKGLMTVVIGFAVSVKVLASLCYVVARAFCPKETSENGGTGDIVDV